MRLLAAVVALLALPASASAATAVVSMPAKYFSPAQLTVVSGDEVVFRNSDFTGDVHNVQASDGAFASGPIARFGSSRHVLTDVGRHPYVCTIHPGMSGEVVVAAGLLSAPAEAGLAGEPVELSGRVPAGIAVVGVERLTPAGWAPEAEVVPGADGAFATVVTPAESATYRAVSAAGESAPVDVPVLSGLRIQTRVRGRVLSAAVHPAPAGTWVVLERYVRERFDWRRARRVRLGSAPARFRLRHARGIARVLVERGRRTVPLAVSAPLRLRDGRPARDPTAGDVPAGEGTPPTPRTHDAFRVPERPL